LSVGAFICLSFLPHELSKSPHDVIEPSALRAAKAKSGGKDAPTDKGYAKIYSNGYAFAALKADGSIKAWGDSKSDGKDAPTNKGYINIYSSDSAFAALKADGTRGICTSITWVTPCSD
jgi:hypothetical protein